jgi:hypothetical protein
VATMKQSAQPFKCHRAYCLPAAHWGGCFPPQHSHSARTPPCRAKASSNLLGQQAGWIPVDLSNVTVVTWPAFKQCPAGTPYPMSSNCPHASSWGYTDMDAKMAQACQDPQPYDPVDKKIKRTMLRSGIAGLVMVFGEASLPLLPFTLRLVVGIHCIRMARGVPT